MAHSPSKKRRLHLRSRARDDVLLNRLLGEVRSHEKKVKDELRRDDGTIADLRSALEEERNYISRLRKERDLAKEKLEDALAAVDTARRDLAEMQASHVGAESHYKRKISDLENAVADALRKKNRERLARDIAVKKKVTMDLQRETEKSLKTLLEKCDVTFAASGVKFDAEASSSEDEGGPPPEPPSPAPTRECAVSEEAAEQPAPSAPKTSEIEATTGAPSVVAETSDSSTASEH